MSFSRVTAYQVEEFFKSHPEFLKEIIRDLYKETAIEFKERLTSKEAAKYLNISIHIVTRVKEQFIHCTFERF